MIYIVPKPSCIPFLLEFTEIKASFVFFWKFHRYVYNLKLEVFKKTLK